MATPKAAQSVADPNPDDDFQAPVIPGTWDEIEESQFTGEYEVLENGVYDFYLMDCEKRVGQNSGNEYVALTLCHERPDEETPEGGQHKFLVWENMHFTPKTLGMAKRTLRILGVDLSGLPTPEPGVVDDELFERIEDAKDSGTFPVRIKKTRYKAQDESVKVRNEVVRFLDDN